MRRFPARVASVVAVLAIASLGLAGCLDTGFPAQSSTTSPRGIASGEPTPSHATSPSPTPSTTPSTQPATPVSMTCEQLIPLQALYNVNPNYALVPTSTAASDTLAAKALADHGTACKVVHTSSGATAYVTVSQPSASILAADRDAAGSSRSVTDPSSGKATTVYGSGAKLQGFSKTRRFTAEADSGFDPDDLTAILAIAVNAAG